eukprot:62269-Chlamydomonas_euryale.AAC.8
MAFPSTRSSRTPCRWSACPAARMRMHDREIGDHARSGGAARGPEPVHRATFPMRPTPLLCCMCPGKSRRAAPAPRHAAPRRVTLLRTLAHRVVHRHFVAGLGLAARARRAGCSATVHAWACESPTPPFSSECACAAAAAAAPTAGPRRTPPTFRCPASEPGCRLPLRGLVLGCAGGWAVACSVVGEGGTPTPLAEWIRRGPVRAGHGRAEHRGGSCVVQWSRVHADLCSPANLLAHAELSDELSLSDQAVTLPGLITLYSCSPQTAPASDWSCSAPL